MLFTGLVLAFQVFTVPPIPPRSQSEPAPMREAASLAASTQAAPKNLLTHAERSEYRETGRYAEAVTFYRELARRSPFARLVPMGESGEGRMLYALIVSKDKAFSPEAARRTKKPVLLLQNGIHAGENGGKDAAMMLLRDVLVTGRLAYALDHAILISIAVFNPDGHEHVSAYNRINENGPAEMGFRVNARRLNLNRDYLKADTPEMKAWLNLYSAWRPDLLIDNHVTDGSDNPYDVTLATHTEQDIAAPVGSWVKEVYLKDLMNGLMQLGHVPGYYFEGRGRDGKSLAIMTASPRYSTGYAAAQNRAALLVETHSLKSFKTRVWSHYDIMKLTLDTLSRSGDLLRQASVDADRAMERLEPGFKVFLQGSPGETTEAYTLHTLAAERPISPVTGAPITRYTSKAVDQEVLLNRSLKEVVAPTAPAGYLVPRQWTEVIDLLARHGVRLEITKQEIRDSFESYRFENVRFAPAPFEGRFQVSTLTAKPVKEVRVIPAGSVYVPMAQPAGKVAMHILEPEAPDSAVRWGFFHPIFEQKEYFSDYVFEPIAASMLEKYPELKAQFEAKIAAEKDFAGNARARLTWLFERSPYFEFDKNVYPVVRTEKPVYSTASTR